MTWDPASETIWKVLESKPSRVGIYYASEIRRGVDGALLAKDSTTGARHLLMRVSSELEFRPDVSSRGVKIELRRLEGDEGGLFCDFWCSDPAKEALFGVMVDELLGRWSAGEGSGPTVAGRVLAAWRSLLGTEPNGSLTLQEQAGLIVELDFLEALARISPHAVAFWRGPDGHPQDFVSDEWIVELKASMNQSSVFVHGASQLDSAPADRLYLAVFGLSLSPNGRSLDEQVERIRVLVGADDEFERKLHRVRYRDSDAAMYGANRFSVGWRKLYVVGEGFPRITRSDMRARFDEHAVGALEYELLLSALTTYLISPATLDRFPSFESE